MPVQHKACELLSPGPPWRPHYVLLISPPPFLQAFGVTRKMPEESKTNSFFFFLQFNQYKLLSDHSKQDLTSFKRCI